MIISVHLCTDKVLWGILQTLMKDNITKVAITGEMWFLPKSLVTACSGYMTGDDICHRLPWHRKVLLPLLRHEVPSPDETLASGGA